MTVGAADGAIWGSSVPLRDGQLLCPLLCPKVGGAEHGAKAATCQQ